LKKTIAALVLATIPVAVPVVVASSADAATGTEFKITTRDGYRCNQYGATIYKNPVAKNMTVRRKGIEFTDIQGDQGGSSAFGYVKPGRRMDFGNVKVRDGETVTLTVYKSVGTRVHTGGFWHTEWTTDYDTIYAQRVLRDKCA